MSQRVSKRLWLRYAWAVSQIDNVDRFVFWARSPKCLTVRSFRSTSNSHDFAEYMASLTRMRSDVMQFSK